MKALFFRAIGFIVIMTSLCTLSLDRIWAQNRNNSQNNSITQADEVVVQANLRGMRTSALVNNLVRSMDFQFIPSIQDGQVNGTYSIYKYRDVIGFPLWLMINMNGPLIVDKSLFTVNSVNEKVIDGSKAWLINLSCADTVNGKFDLQFVIDATTGKAMVEVKHVEKGETSAGSDRGEETYKRSDSFMFQGHIFPKKLLFKHTPIDHQKHYVTLKNREARALRRAISTEELLDSIVPRLNFRVSSSIGGQYYRTFNRTLLERDFAKRIWVDKANEKWYVRIEYAYGPARRKIDEQKAAGIEAKMNRSSPEYILNFNDTFIIDLVINSINGESFYRAGQYNYLKKNWQRERISVFLPEMGGILFFDIKMVFTASN